jgi:hypothetical protein
MSLRALLTGGDRLHRRPPPDFPALLINHYGPTENTVVTTAGVVERNAPAGMMPPIGRPIANTQVYVLDDRMRWCLTARLANSTSEREPGAGLSAPTELTAEKFVAHPFDAAPGARLYRTGDRVRWTAAGEIEFLGRIDHQVKIRGVGSNWARSRPSSSSTRRCRSAWCSRSTTTAPRPSSQRSCSRGIQNSRKGCCSIFCAGSCRPTCCRRRCFGWRRGR